MPSKIPARQTLSGDGGNKLYVPSDGEGNALVTGNLQVDGKLIGDASLSITTNVDIGGSLNANGEATIGGPLSVQEGITSTGLIVNGSANITGTLSAGNLIVTNSETAPSFTATGNPGFIGNGSGLTGLPIATLSTPIRTVQSTITDFGFLVPNRFDPEIEIPTPILTIGVDMAGLPSGLYIWKSDANILLQDIWNSASGLVFWDGTKVSGQTTWSLVQDLSAFNPEYFLTWSYLSFSSLTKFDVQMECSYPSVPINIGQPTNYYINVYLILPS